MIDLKPTSRAFCAVVLAAILLPACSTISNINPFDNNKSEAEEIASDPARISILALDDNLEVTGTMLPSEIVLPQAYINTDWPQTGGYPTHTVQHTDAPGSLQRVWAAGIGKGSFRKGRVVASPVVAGGRLYAVDADNRVVSLDANTGKTNWRYEIEVAKIGKSRRGGANIIERIRDPLSFRDTGGSDKEAIGGGVAVADGRVYVTSGFGLILALDAVSGEEIWRTETRTPVHSAPAIDNGRLFAISDDNELFAVNAQTGEVLWTYQAIIETARLMTAPSPAVIDDVVIAPFSSGELVALRVQNGSVLWQDALDTSGNLTPLASLNDIGSGPVIADGYVFAAAQSGSLGAFDLRTGQRVWSQPAGSIGFPLVIGDFIFTVTTEGELTALSKTDGTVIWITQLDAFKNPKKRKDKIFWAGPIIAGGRLVLMSSEGRGIEVSPNDGTIIREFKTAGDVYVSPIIANGTIYYITDNAKIHALR